MRFQRLSEGVRYILTGQVRRRGHRATVASRPVERRRRHGRHDALQYHLAAEPLPDAPVWNGDLRGI